MTPSVETFQASAQRLVANFETDQSHYLSKEYVEAQARVDFVTPFFEALGWDVGNEAWLAHEARIRRFVTLAYAHQR